MEKGAVRTAPAEPLPSRSPAAQAAPLVVAGHELTLFIESAPLLAAMVRDIRAARERVWVESYIFLADAGGSQVAEALSERARAGLDVRVLYDAFGSQTTPSAFFRRMAEAGVQVHAFHSLWEAFSQLSLLRVLNRRDHRKLLVIDDRVAYFGGMNLVDQGTAVPAEPVEGLPISAGWRDVHVRLAGPQQVEVAESFERSWRRAHGQKVKRRPRRYRRGLLAAGAESIQFFDSGPGKKHTRAARVFGQLLRRARRRVLLSMAYFLPVGPVLRQLLRAARRGVFLQVVVPGRSDVPLVQRATCHLYRRLLRARFHIYERQVHMLHSKVMVVDDEWSVLGSCNLDARSLYINLEFLAVIHSRKLAAALGQIICGEIRHSQRITLRACRQRSGWQRLLDWLAWALRWGL